MPLRLFSYYQISPCACFYTFIACKCIPKTEFPNLQTTDQYLLSDSSSIRLEIKCTINAMHLNHPENNRPHPKSPEKFFSTKPVSGAKKFGDCCPHMYHFFMCSRILYKGHYTLSMCHQLINTFISLILCVWDLSILLYVILFIHLSFYVVWIYLNLFILLFMDITFFSIFTYKQCYNKHSYICNFCKSFFRVYL